MASGEALETGELQGFLEDLVALRRMANASAEPLRVDLSGADGAAQVPPGIEDLFARACRALGVEGLRLVDGAAPALDSFERIARHRLALGRRNWSRISSGEELEAAAAGVQAASSQACFHAGRLRSPDGAQLDLYAHGPEDGEPVVLIQALGMPIELAHELLLELGSRARVLSWEVRGEFHLEDDFDSLGTGIDDQIADLLLVLDHFGVERAHLLSFCIAAPLAMRAAIRHPERFASLCVVNGGFGLAEARTDYEQQFHAVFPRVGASRPAAQLFFKLFKGGGTGSSSGPGIAVEDPDAHIVYLPYVHPERLYRYGRLVTPLLRSDALSWAGEIARPTLLVATQHDPVSHPRAAAIVAERVPGARLETLPGDRHLGLMHRPAELSALWWPFALTHRIR